MAMASGIFSDPPMQVVMSWQRQTDGTYLGDRGLASVRKLRKKRARFIVKKTGRTWVLSDRKLNGAANGFHTLGEAQNRAKSRVRSELVLARQASGRQQALGHAYEYVKSLEDRIEELERKMADLETE